MGSEEELGFEVRDGVLECGKSNIVHHSDIQQDPV